MSRRNWIRDDNPLKCPECGRFMQKNRDQEGGTWWLCVPCDYLVMGGSTP